ncbi:MAG: sensor histidine kinase [Chthoniobacterales bacterium]
METAPTSETRPSAGTRELAAFGNFILARSEDIARHWVGAVDRSPQIESSVDLTFRQLLDHFPQLCIELANILRAPGAESPRAQASEQSSAHGRQRLQQGYQLEEVIRELCIIRHDFQSRWMPAFEQEHGPMSPEARRSAQRIVQQFFDDLLVDSTTQFVSEQHDKMLEFDRRLLEQKEQLEEANSLKSRFLALMSHELRTPLTPALLEVTGMRSDPRLPSQFRESLDRVEHNIRLEAALIDDLLDATRLARGNFQMEFADGNVHEIVEAAIERCRLDFATKDLTVEVQLQATDTKVFADAKRLRRAFIALLRNAANVSRKGGVVRVSSHNDGDRYKIDVAVQDSGSEFDATIADRIFEPFEEGRRSLFGLGGLGVSRYVAQRIVEAHGGNVSAVSAGPDGGAIYAVKLPVRR